MSMSMSIIYSVKRFVIHLKDNIILVFILQGGSIYRQVMSESINVKNPPHQKFYKVSILEQLKN